MAWHNNPRIVTDGLILLLDAGNANSYPGSGTTWYDLSGNGNNGTLSTATIGTTNSNVMTFDGATNYISLPNDVGYTTDVSAFSWFKATADDPTGSYHIICGGQELELSRQQSSAYIRNGVYTTARYVQNDGSGLNDHNWHNVGLTFGSSLKKSYIDSAYANQQATSGALTYSFSSRRLGQFGTASYYLKGQMAVYMMYNRILTDDEVTQNFDAMKGRFGL